MADPVQGQPSHSKARLIELLRKEIVAAIERLDRGEGKPLDIEWLKAEGRRRQAIGHYATSQTKPPSE